MLGLCVINFGASKGITMYVLFFFGGGGYDLLSKESCMTLLFINFEFDFFSLVRNKYCYI